MQESLPKISIAIPIYNEEKFIFQTIESLLSQSYKNIELIILDNCSTDSTEDICQQFQTLDNIQYIRSKNNIGAAKNYQKGLELATGDYFMWAGGHDLWSKNLVEDCIMALEKKPTAVLAFGSTLWIDEHNQALEKYNGWTDTQGLDIVARFFCIFLGNMHPVLGIIRLNSLKGIEFKEILGTDLLVLLQLVLKGDFIHATQAKCYRRELSPRKHESYLDKIKRYNSSEYNLVGKATLISKSLPIKLPFLIIQKVISAQISFSKKIMILLILLLFFPIKFILDVVK